MVKRLHIFVMALLMAPLAAEARDVIRSAGSSTVFPFAAAAAEQFGHAGKFRTPIIESTGTGGGLKMFCEGVGGGFLDMANASRTIKQSEIDACKAHGVTSITELKIGYDGIVLANAINSPNYPLTLRVLFLALAREVPKNGKLISNPYKRWREIDQALPDAPIEVYGPPPSSGTRDSFVELVMQEGCKQVVEMKQAVPSDEIRKHQCGTLREDGAFIEAGEDDNLIVQKLLNNPNALGVFGYNFLESNVANVKANGIDGVMPTYEAIESGKYHIARALYVYVKNAHADRVPGLREFTKELVSDTAASEEGYLVMKGLLPLNAEEHTEVKKIAAELKPMPL